MDTTRKMNLNPKNKNPKKKKNTWVSLLKYTVLILFVAVVAVTLTVVFYVQGIIKNLEDIDPNKVSQQLYENSVIVDSQGRVLENILAEGLRKVVKYEDISPAVIDAFIAVEDKTFLTHNGFNLIRMIGATMNHFIKGDALGGVSTITQQLARNVYLFDRRQERSLKRKIEEAYYTIQLEKYLTKEQIMEGYLNLIFFGMESYGVEAASQTYFGKSVKDVDYIEAALLVGTVKAPSFYSPMLRYEKKHVPEDAYIIDDSDQLYTIVFNEDCTERYQDCLYLMHENGKITDKQYEEGIHYDIKKKLKYVKPEGQEISSYFSDIVVEEAMNELMAKYRLSKSEALELLTSGGLKIESTIDFDMQKTLESHFEKDNFTYYFSNSLEKALIRFQEDHGLEANGKADGPTLDKFCELSGIDRGLFTDEFYAVGEEAEVLQSLKYGLNKLGYFVTNEYFPDATPLFDEEGNIIDPDTRTVILRRYDNIIDENKSLIIRKGEYEFSGNGSLILFEGGSMKFYPHYNKENQELQRVQVVVDKTFKLPNGYETEKFVSGKFPVDSIHIYYGRDVLIPDEFKKQDEDGNVVISKQFLKDNPNFFVHNPEDDSLRVSSDNYVMSTNPIIQPQAAMTIVDHRSGELKALVGGRNLKGSFLYNRATNPRQPGSAIKPISVYTAAMDSGRYSPSSVVDDRPVYLAGSKTYRWPVNWYETYRTKWWYYGLITIREAVNHSSNVPPAVLVDELGVETCVDYLKKYGVTTIVEEGPINDMNIAAMAMGAMSVGISPLEMTQAYACIANDGMMNKISAVKRITNNRGEVLLEKTPNPTRVLDPKVAYLIKDLLRTSVTEGLARSAKMQNHDVYGKTGTTSDNIDIWFVGFTPYYTGAVWFGNDINIPLSKTSEFNADFWRKVMEDIHKDLEPKHFEKPEGIVTAEVDIISGKRPTELTKKDPRNTIRSDIFIRGFEPYEDDDVHVEVKICRSSGKLATSSCPYSDTVVKVMVKRPEPYNPKDHKDIKLRDGEYDAPTETCDIHSGGNYYNGLNYGVRETLMELANQEYMARMPHLIIMKDGSMKVLPAGSVIRSDQSVDLPGGEKIKAEDIRDLRLRQNPIIETKDPSSEDGTTDNHNNQNSNPSNTQPTTPDNTMPTTTTADTTPTTTTSSSSE